MHQARTSLTVLLTASILSLPLPPPTAVAQLAPHVATILVGVNEDGTPEDGSREPAQRVPAVPGQLVARATPTSDGGCAEPSILIQLPQGEPGKRPKRVDVTTTTDADCNIMVIKTPGRERAAMRRLERARKRGEHPDELLASEEGGPRAFVYRPYDWHTHWVALALSPRITGPGFWNFFARVSTGLNYKDGMPSPIPGPDRVVGEGAAYHYFLRTGNWTWTYWWGGSDTWSNPHGVWATSQGDVRSPSGASWAFMKAQSEGWPCPGGNCGHNQWCYRRSSTALGSSGYLWTCSGATPFVTYW